MQKCIKTPTMLQMEAVECGAASLGMVLGYFGRHVPLEELRVECGVSRDGSKASNILRAARVYGLEAKGYKRSVSELGQFQLPLVLFWEFNHFVVLEGISKGFYYLNDPALGHRAVADEDFAKSFTGVVLEFAKGPKFKPGGQRESPIWAAVKELRGATKTVVFLSLVGLLLAILGVILPAYMRAFVDFILVARLRNWVFPLLGFMTATMILAGIASWLMQKNMAIFETRLKLSLATRFFWHVLRLPIEFFNQRHIGDVVNRILSCQRVGQFVASELISSILSLFFAACFAVVMFYYDKMLTLVVVVGVVLNLILAHVAKRMQANYNQQASFQGIKMMSFMLSGLSSIETLKATGSESEFFTRFAGLQAMAVNRRQQFAELANLLNAIPAFLSMLMIAGTLSVGGYLVLHGGMTFGMLVAFLVLMVAMVTPFMQLSAQLQSGQHFEIQSKRLDDVFHFPLDARWRVTEQDAQKPSLTGLVGFVEIRDVTFGYDKYSPANIQNFSMSLKPGQRVAIVGLTGSGKTTIGKLMCGLYQPWSGDILYDGVPLTSVPRQVLGGYLAHVDQDIRILTGSVRDNLTLWDDMVSEDDITQAGIDACIHDDIMALPNGYDTILEENGRNLSGGQVQRLDIARALALNPAVLILDEATSALDPVTEKAIDDNLRRRGCTCIYIAHRLSTVRDCDEIIVLDRGQIKERGTHEELVKTNGIYQKLIRVGQ